MALPLDQFVRRLAESGLLTEADVQTFVAALPESNKPADGEQLARLLVKHKKLTAYQAQEIYKGQGKNLVLGNYVILDKLGQGGMGLVLKAEHKRMKRIVAVKVLSAAALKSPEAVARFHREVEAAARLEHPNIVAAHDADEAHGTHFLAMQYVEGSDLSSLIKREGPLPVAKALHCIVQAARGLEYAHQEGVIHRDIKPANLLLDNKGTVKILDMGLARFEASIAGDGAPELTGTGQIMGTVDFMAPEQAVNTKHADQRADIYSLGISLWYLLTGKVAYDGETLMERIMGHQNKPIPSLRAACPGVPAELEAVFVKMVAKTPETRYQSMTEVLTALSHCVPGEGGSAPSVTVLPGEDSRLSAFLRANSASGTASGGARSPAAVQAIDQAALTLAPEATLNVKAQSEDTDPKSNVFVVPPSGGKQQISRTASAVKPTKAGTASAVPTKRKSARVPAPIVIGGVLAAGLLLLLLPLGIWLLTRGDKTQDTAAIAVPAGGSIESVREDDGGDLPPGPPVTPAGTYALEFDGVDDYVELPNMERGRGTLTLEAIATPARTGNSGAVVQICGVAWLSIATREEAWGAVFQGTDRRAVRWGDQNLAGGRTDHVAVVAEGTSLRLYINGQRSGSIQSLDAKRSGLASSTIGAGSGIGRGRRYFAGKIHAVRISTSARYAGAFTAPARLTKDADTIALYQFDEGQGSELKDTSGNGYHGRIVGAKWAKVDGGAIDTSPTPPAGDYALRFAGTGEVLANPDLKLPANGSWTVEGWITPRDPLPKNNANCLVFIAGNPWLSLKNEGSKGVRWGIGGPVFKPPALLTSTERVAMNERTHVAYMRGAGGLWLYVNGVSQGQLPLAFGGSAALRICRLPPDRDVPFHGDIDEIRVSSVARYKENFAPKPRFEPDDDTLALFHFDEGQGDVANDSSRHGRHVKIVGGIWVRANDSMPTAPTVPPKSTTTSSAVVEPPTNVVYLDDLQEEPPKGKWMGRHGMGSDGRPCIWLGKKPAHSLFTHPGDNSSFFVSYPLRGKYDEFQATIGMLAKPISRLTFRVWGDDKKLWESLPQSTAQKGTDLRVSVRGVKELKLEVHCPGSFAYAHAIWIDPRLTEEAASGAKPDPDR